MSYHLAIFEQAEDVYDYALRESHRIFDNAKSAADAAYTLALTLPDNQYARVSDSHVSDHLKAYKFEQMPTA